MATAEAPSHRDSSVLRELIVRLICETVQETVDKGGTPQQGGEEALHRLAGRGWTSLWLELFGPSTLASQWRQFTVQPERDRFFRATEVMQPASLPQPQPTGLQPRKPAEMPENSSGALLVPEAANFAHGRESAVSVLSRDLERLLRTNLRIAGIWIKAGELRRKDILTMRDEMRERAMATLAGFKQRRSRLMRLVDYFQGDADDLRSLVVNGRIGLEELRVFLADAN